MSVSEGSEPCVPYFFSQTLSLDMHEISVWVNARAYMCLHACVRTHIHVCVCSCVHACMRVCIRKCVCECVFVCKCICVCVPWIDLRLLERIFGKPKGLYWGKPVLQSTMLLRQKSETPDFLRLQAYNDY